MVETVTAQCAEELSEAVAPWQLTLRQISPGSLEPQITVATAEDIIITNDRWRGILHGYGGTAAGYVTLCGIAEPRQIHWNGYVFDDVALPCASGSGEWEFHTPLGTNHWVILIPERALADRMDLHPVVISSLGARLLQPRPHQFQRLNSLAWGSLRMPGEIGADVADRLGVQIREQILDEAVEVLGEVVGEDPRVTTRGRSAAYRRAIRHIDRSPSTATLSSTAAAAGVSNRVLQLAFQENLGASPNRYIKLCRLNLLHSRLREAQSHRSSVASTMEECGLSEFGRTAGQYRQLFGELPSETRGHKRNTPLKRTVDIINRDPGSQRTL